MKVKEGDVVRCAYCKRPIVINQKLLPIARRGSNLFCSTECEDLYHGERLVNWKELIKYISECGRCYQQDIARRFGIEGGYRIRLSKYLKVLERKGIIYIFKNGEQNIIELREVMRVMSVDDIRNFEELVKKVEEISQKKDYTKEIEELRTEITNIKEYIDKEISTINRKLNILKAAVERLVEAFTK